MTSRDKTPTGDAHERREAYSAANVRASLGATQDEDTVAEDSSAEKDELLARLLTTDQRPEHLDPDALDDILEPPPSQAPTLSLDRRTKLISKVAGELEVHYRTSGSLEQILHRMRVADSRSQKQVAESVNALAHQLVGKDDRDVTSEDITSIERTLVIVDDEYERAVAAAWAATIELDDDIVTRAYAKSLRLNDDAPALSYVAGIDDDVADNIDDPRVAVFEELYHRARTLNVAADEADPPA